MTGDGPAVFETQNTARRPSRGATVAADAGFDRRIEERLVVLLAQQGDRAALSRLIDVYDRRLLYFIRRIVGDDEALDVLQSVWLAVHRKLRGLKSADAFRVWLYRIAHDRAITQLRRKVRTPLAVDDLTFVPSAVDESAGDDFDNAELVHRALGDLSVDHRRVLTLRFLEEMSIDEIAQVIEEPAGTVKSRLHYAKRALRRRIEELTHE